MAQSFYTIDLQDTVFPMLSEQQGRTIIGTVAGREPSKAEKPGVAYCHNVMPSEYGLDSVGYLQAVSAVTSLPEGTTFVDVRIIYGSKNTRLHLAWDTQGTLYLLKPDATEWIIIPLVRVPPTTTPLLLGPNDITLGTVNGVSYIFYSKTACFKYDEDTEELIEVELIGLDVTTILGVVASSGYLVAYSDIAIAWSSTIDPLDFVPSQVTGAGGGNIAGISGVIRFVTYNSLGLLVYADANILAGTYTGNAQFPFKFREVESSQGGISLDLVAYEANSAAQYVFSKAGLQAVTSQRAEVILPEVTDFLAGRRFEDYNESTKLYEITSLALTQAMKKKIKFVASRYLIISYGLPGEIFTHAIVFDVILKKLGKLKLNHVDVFELIGMQPEVSKESIAFLLATGEVQTMDFSTVSAGSGVVILGKLQFSRTRLFTLLGVEVENVDANSPLSVSTQLALDGKNFTVVEGIPKTPSTNLREYYFRATGINHSIALIGKFNLVTVQIRFTVSGRR